MDVKGVVRNILPFQLNRASETKKKPEVDGHTETAPDRDPNGQSQSQGEESRRNLTDEEIQAAIKILENIPGVKDNGLTIRFSRNDGVAVVYVEDHLGKVVRRIPESELSQLKDRSADKKTGHLINKAM